MSNWLSHHLTHDVKKDQHIVICYRDKNVLLKVIDIDFKFSNSSIEPKLMTIDESGEISEEVWNDL